MINQRNQSRSRAATSDSDSGLTYLLFHSGILKCFGWRGCCPCNRAWNTRLVLLVADVHRIGIGRRRRRDEWHGHVREGSEGVDVDGQVDGVDRLNPPVVPHKPQTFVDPDPAQKALECTSKLVHVMFDPRHSGGQLRRCLCTLLQLSNLCL